jgi:hypothetical protein
MVLPRISTRVYLATIVSADNIIYALALLNSNGNLVDFDDILEDCTKIEMENAIVWSRLFATRW